MVDMFVKFLFTIYVIGTFGHSVMKKLDHDNTKLHFSDHGNLMLPELKEFVFTVYRKIEGMERLLTKKDERIDQLESNIASQMAEIKWLKQGMTSLEEAIIEKDQIVDKLSTRLSGLETKIRIASTQVYHNSQNPHRSPLVRSENNETRSDETFDSTSRSGKMSVSGLFIPKTATYQTDSEIPTHSDKHISDGDDYLPDQSVEDRAVTRKGKEAEELLTAKFSRCQQKRVVPTIRTAIAFHVTLSKRKAVTNNDVVVYDHETLDQGDGYNPGDGVYIAPESGTYVLTWTTICYPHNYFKTLLVVNGAVRGTSWTDSDEINDYHQTTSIIVLTLNQGDHIFIRMGPTHGHGTIISDNIVGYSSFSGWKLD